MPTLGEAAALAPEWDRSLVLPCRCYRCELRRPPPTRDQPVRYSTLCVHEELAKYARAKAQMREDTRPLAVLALEKLKEENGCVVDRLGRKWSISWPTERRFSHLVQLQQLTGVGRGYVGLYSAEDVITHWRFGKATATNVRRSRSTWLQRYKGSDA